MVVEALGHRLRIESVYWNAEGKAVVTLQVVRLDPAFLKAMEADGWEVAPREDETPREWLAE